MIEIIEGFAVYQVMEQSEQWGNWKGAVQPCCNFVRHFADKQEAIEWISQEAKQAMEEHKFEFAILPTTLVKSTS